MAEAPQDGPSTIELHPGTVRAKGACCKDLGARPSTLSEIGVLPKSWLLKACHSLGLGPRFESSWRLDASPSPPSVSSHVSIRDEGRESKKGLKRAMQACERLLPGACRKRNDLCIAFSCRSPCCMTTSLLLGGRAHSHAGYATAAEPGNFLLASSENAHWIQDCFAKSARLSRIS